MTKRNDTVYDEQGRQYVYEQQLDNGRHLVWREVEREDPDSIYDYVTSREPVVLDRVLGYPKGAVDRYHADIAALRGEKEWCEKEVRKLREESVLLIAEMGVAHKRQAHEARLVLSGIMDKVGPGKKIRLGNDDYIVTRLDPDDDHAFYVTRDLGFTPSVED